ncbi:hypothetical protein [Umezawaea sp.]|uniref:hypothetical protein n=1 Tax=Umezawaea sp. TaxID=1955258 RepID=UPI002ECFD4C6
MRLVLDDLIMVLMANGGIRATSNANAVAASRRFAALLVRSFDTESSSAPLPPVVHLPLTAVI